MKPGDYGAWRLVRVLAPLGADLRGELAVGFRNSLSSVGMHTEPVCNGGPPIKLP